MATYTDIPTANLEPGKPIRSIDIIALRDNLIAALGGANGAPRVATAAINNGAVTDAKITDMNASKLTGTINGARIPTGHGSVGTYAFVIPRLTGSASNVGWGGTVSGSRIAPSGVINIQSGSTAADELKHNSSTTALSGTWRIMGSGIIHQQSGLPIAATLAVRIS